MSQENEIEAEKPSLTTDFLPSDGASCYASSAQEPDIGEWLGPLGVKAMEDAAACYASLGACLKHHEEQAEVRKRHVDETLRAVEKMDRMSYAHADDYDDVRSYNLQQAAFDGGWADRHKEWADALRVILLHNVKAHLPLGAGASVDRGVEVVTTINAAEQGGSQRLDGASCSLLDSETACRLMIDDVTNPPWVVEAAKEAVAGLGKINAMTKATTVDSLGCGSHLESDHQPAGKADLQDTLRSHYAAPQEPSPTSHKGHE